MQRYLNVSSLGTDRIEFIVKVLSGETYITVRKYVFMRIDLTPFIHEVLLNHLTVYAKGLGEVYLDQTMTILNSIKVLTVNDVEVTDNVDLYEKLRLL